MKTILRRFSYVGSQPTRWPRAALWQVTLSMRKIEHSPDGISIKQEAPLPRTRCHSNFCQLQKQAI